MCVHIKTQAEADAWSASTVPDTCVHVNGEGLVFRQLPIDETVAVYEKGSASFYGDGKLAIQADADVSLYGRIKADVYAARSIRAFDRVSLKVQGNVKVKAGPAVLIELCDSAARIEGGLVRTGRQPDYGSDVLKWAAHWGVDVEGEGDDAILTVYKCVDEEYLSQYQTWVKGNFFRTSYRPGSLPSAPDWGPGAYCGKGLHFSPTPFLAGAYVNNNNVKDEDRRYLRCRVRVADCVTLGDKIKARRVVTPVEEVDFSGKPVPTPVKVEPEVIPPRYTTISEELLERARQVPRYQGKLNARAIARELGVSRGFAADIVYRLSKSS